MSPDADRPADSSPRRRARRPRRRRLPALVVIVLAGLVAVAAAFALASALDDDRPHGPYLIGAWTFGDRDSLARGRQGRRARRGERRLAAVARRRQRRRAAPGHRLHRRGRAQGLPRVRHAHRLRRGARTRSSPPSRRRSWPRPRLGGGTPPPWPPGSRPTTSPAWTSTGRPSRRSRRDEFSAFVEELARRLHDDDRLIAVDVYPKLKEPGGWDGPRAQDWERLGRAVDQFRVMTYNYSGSWSGPGPLSPPEWMDRVLSFAETQVAPRRIVMGLGFYGREWRGSTTADLVWDDVADDPRRPGPPGDADGVARALPRLRARRRRPRGVLPRRHRHPRQAGDAPLEPPAHPRRLRLADGPGGPARVARAGARAAHPSSRLTATGQRT